MATGHTRCSSIVGQVFAMMYLANRRLCAHDSVCGTVGEQLRTIFLLTEPPMTSRLEMRSQTFFRFRISDEPGLYLGIHMVLFQCLILVYMDMV